ncbi:ELKS Rab6-interacting CAST family member 1 isoform X5 [Labeo rohita]|uniref:ELKS Rab6-interacting CAST family member 1 isoform X5 n=1 Tax=Labeo rohita TaxID=84645 RepID=A0A498N727_LABRO|nr:ELKS Rab6-interacting CAST family member 1 isoform X5 [Labeo rohita]
MSSTHRGLVESEGSERLPSLVKRLHGHKEVSDTGKNITGLCGAASSIPGFRHVTGESMEYVFKPHGAARCSESRALGPYVTLTGVIPRLVSGGATPRRVSFPRKRALPSSLGLFRGPSCATFLAFPRQEALLAAISEKDANIALLELSSSKKKKTQDEVALLKREKDRLVHQLKQQVRTSNMLDADIPDQGTRQNHRLK